MKYWQQQWTFALWCATTGRGISRDILSEKQLRVKLRVFFFQCHVCFMERRIFYEMGSIQNVRDSTFNQTNIKHDISSYKEFALSLEWSHQQISALCTAHTMVLAMFLFMFPDMVLHPQAWAIPAHMQNLTMKGAESIRETWSLLSEMSEHRPSF